MNIKKDEPWLLELGELSTGPLFLTQRDNRVWEDDPKLREILSMVAEIQDTEERALAKPTADRLAFRESFIDTYFELQKKIRMVESLYLDLPAIYVWNAYVWVWLGNYDSAYISISYGLLRCEDKTDLCYKMGNLQSEQSRLSAFGWWMQACMLAHDLPHPYLYLATAAADTGLRDLELRLLNLSDARWGMLRLPTDHNMKLRDLAEKDRKKVKESLENFGLYMIPFLPPADLLPSPEDNSGRAGEIQLQKFFGESSPMIKEKVRLQRIFDRGKGFILDMETGEQKQI